MVKPAGALVGEVQAFGAKNAVLKQMAACLLATGQHRLTNVPDITDVSVMGELLQALGCRVQRPAPHELLIDVPQSGDSSKPCVLRSSSLAHCSPGAEKPTWRYPVEMTSVSDQ